MPKVAVGANTKRGPAGIGDEVVLLGKIFLDEGVADGAREWNVEGAPGMDMADFGTTEVEFLGFELMRTDGDARPCGDDFF